MREFKNPSILLFLFVIGLISVIGFILSWDTINFHLTPNKFDLRFPILGFVYVLGKLGVGGQYIKLILNLSVFVVIFIIALFLIRQKRLYYQVLGLFLFIFLSFAIFFIFWK